MKWEILLKLGMQVSDEITLYGGGRIVRVNLGYGGPKELRFSNHNIFRLDASDQIVWQVQREENGCVDWESRNRHAKEENPTSEGYFDPFWSLGVDEGGALSPEPKGVYRQGCAIYVTTRWWVYRLDPETGVASCTGDQVK